MARNQDPKRTAYRSELDAAEQRVRSLEDDLADARDALDRARRGPTPSLADGARQRALAFAVVGVTVLLAGVGAGWWLLTHRLPPPPEVKDAPSAQPTPAPRGESILWQGTPVAVSRFGMWEGHRQPYLYDVNADGVEDMVGVARRPKQATFVAAFDGKSAELLWESEPLGDPAHDRPPLMFVFGDRVIAASAVGEVLAIDLRTGKTLARQLLSDPVAKLCASGATVAIHSHKGASLVYSTQQGFTKGEAECDQPSRASEEPPLGSTRQAERDESARSRVAGMGRSGLWAHLPATSGR